MDSATVSSIPGSPCHGAPTTAATSGGEGTPPATAVSTRPDVSAKPISSRAKKPLIIIPFTPLCPPLFLMHSLSVFRGPGIVARHFLLFLQDTLMLTRDTVTC